MAVTRIGGGDDSIDDSTSRDRGCNHTIVCAKYCQQSRMERASVFTVFGVRSRCQSGNDEVDEIDGDGRLLCEKIQVEEDRRTDQQTRSVFILIALSLLIDRRIYSNCQWEWNKTS